MSVTKMLQKATIFGNITDGSEHMRIDYVNVDANEVYTTGEDSGEQYRIDINDINVTDYVFYQLTPMNPSDFQ